MKFLKALDGYKRIIALLMWVAAGFAKAAGWGDHTPYIGTAFTILGWDPTGLGVEPGATLQWGVTLWAIFDGVKKAQAAKAAEAAVKDPSRFPAAGALLLLALMPTYACAATLTEPQYAMGAVIGLSAIGLALVLWTRNGGDMKHSLLALGLLLCVVALTGCGNDALPTVPDPVVSATPEPPKQTIVSLAVTARDRDGQLTEVVDRDQRFSIESSPRCSIADQVCPRPSRVTWNVTGAFCETLGDTSGPAIVVVCYGAGVAEVKATDDDSGAKGSTKILVRF